LNNSIARFSVNRQPDEVSDRDRLDASLADTAIAITDIDHPFYKVVSHDWPRSNPRGYLKW